MTLCIYYSKSIIIEREGGQYYNILLIIAICMHVYIILLTILILCTCQALDRRTTCTSNTSSSIITPQQETPLVCLTHCSTHAHNVSLHSLTHTCTNHRVHQVPMPWLMSVWVFVKPKSAKREILVQALLNV